MATTSKILGKDKPAGTTPTVLYTVPASTQTQATLFVANQGGGTTKVRVALSGGSVAATDYIIYDHSLAAGAYLVVTSIALNTGETINVESDTGDASFVANGIEIDRSTF